jgi:hypothetical protein
MSLSEALGEGRLAILRAQLERLTAEFDACDSLRDLKALSVEIREVNREIDELSGGSAAVSAPASPLDELRRKRAERKTG